VCIAAPCVKIGALRRLAPRTTATVIRGGGLRVKQTCVHARLFRRDKNRMLWGAGVFGFTTFMRVPPHSARTAKPLIQARLSAHS